MNESAGAILANLRAVDDERARRGADAALSAKVGVLKTFQQRRFSHTYVDLLHTTRYGPATSFFLQELYGPGDFSRRDAEFVRVVPAIVRLFPHEVVETVATLSELHALSERLDTAMAEQLEGATVSAWDYIRCWQAVGRGSERQAQIELTLEIAARLDRLTRRPLLRNSLRLMRAPARAAGLSELQQFLEAGFDTFRAIDGAAGFISTVRTREQALAARLFAADLCDGKPSQALEAALQALPA